MALRKHLLRIFSVALLPVLLTGCGPDLGVFEEEGGMEKYFESFGDVKGLYDDSTESGASHSYDVSDSLYNETTINDFTWDDSDDEVKKEEYVYIIIPFEDALTIQAIVLFFYAPINVDVELNCFYFNSDIDAPQKIKFLSSPDTEIVHNPETDEDEEVPIQYDDPLKETSMVTINDSFYKEEWNDIVFGGFRQYGFNDGYLHAQKDGLLYIRIENNSGFNRDTMVHTSFTFINLMVRAVEEGD